MDCNIIQNYDNMWKIDKTTACRVMMFSIFMAQK